MGKFNRNTISLIVTSISAPNMVMRTLAEQCSSRSIHFYVIGDVPSPSDFHIDGCDFYSLDRQKQTGFQLAELLPSRHYGRKNIGYLLAIRAGSGMIMETDDDNLPTDDFWEPRQLDRTVKTVQGTGWTNVYSFFSEANIWPRGLPLDTIQQKTDAYENLREKQVSCPIQQGLVNGDPDVDAVFRLVLPAPIPITFKTDRGVAIGSDAWCPFNSQNTAWYPQAYPLLYLPSYCSIRMTDIWRSFVAQRIAWVNGWHVFFKSPDMYQDRNEHNLMRDFEDEIPGYRHNRAIQEMLTALNLLPGVEHLGDNLIRCYEELARMKLVGKEEIPLVEAWVQDLARLG
jgi:hypothetical protein